MQKQETKQKINIEHLKDVLSIPTYYGKESRLRDYLIEFGIKNNIRVLLDNKGNVFLIKGEIKEDGHYPCVVAHLDTVHEDNILLVEHNKKMVIIETEFQDDIRLTATHQGKTVGIGGDNKAGVFIALSVMEEFDNIIGAFFVEEEFGCHGSMLAHETDILKRVGYFIQFDAPTDDWFSTNCCGVELHDKTSFEVVKPLLKEHNVKKIRNIDPYTDVMVLRQQFGVACFNLFAGYYYQHSKYELVSKNAVEKSRNLGVGMIKLLGDKKYD